MIDRYAESERVQMDSFAPLTPTLEPIHTSLVF